MNINPKHDPIQKSRKLRELEKKKMITIGLHKNYANTVWGKTVFGWILNMGVLLFIALTLYFFIKISVIVGTVALIVTFLYVILTQKIATTVVRSRLLRSGGELVFMDAYYDNKVTICNNKTGEVIENPTDWMEWLDDNFTLHDWAR